MADRLSWLALIAALSFSVAVVMLGSGGKASGHPAGRFAAAAPLAQAAR